MGNLLRALGGFGPRRPGGPAGRDACHVAALRGPGHQGKYECPCGAPYRSRRLCLRAEASSGGCGEPGAQRGAAAAQGKGVNKSDVSAGISPRQPFDSWAKFVAELEAEGVGRVWVIDSQLAMK